MQGSLMSRKTPLRTVVAGLVLALAALAATATAALAATFSNPAPIVINESGPATPYPSTVTVAGLTGAITDLNVTLDGLSHTWPDDVSVLLVGPGGQKVVLMSDVGGDSANGLNNVTLTFDDQATQSLPDSAQITTGFYKPTQGIVQDGSNPRPADFPAPAPMSPYATQLSAFDGADPNGAYELYVLDDTGSDGGQIARGFSLDITTAAQCSDGQDNDSDGKTDFGTGPDNDPGCESADDDNETGTPSLSIDDVTVTEGDAGATDATFTVTRSGDTGGTSTVDFATLDGTARASDNDYGARSDTLTFVPGDTTKTITVPVNGDTTDENNENFFVNLSGATNATIEDGQGQGAITNDDPQPQVSISDAPVVDEGDPAPRNATFTVSLSNPSSQQVTVAYDTQDGTAKAPGDYTAITGGAVTFAPGDTEETLTVQVNDDATDEDAENFSVLLSNPQGATIADGTGAGTITDDDTAGITVNPTSGLTTTEAGGTDTFTVVLNSKPTSDVTVPLASSDTTEGTVSPSSLTFTPENYDTPQSATLTGVDDNTDDGDQVYEAITGSATSTDPNYSGRGASDVSVTNTDNDDAPNISISDASVKEGDTGQRDATFALTLSNPSSQPVTVDYATQNGTASASSDYQAGNGTVTFAPGNTEETITVEVNGDTKEEKNETFDVNLSNPMGATIEDGQGKGTIENDDEAPPPPPPPPPPSDKPACNDGRDNDGDGKKDLKDPGCSSKQDDSERNKPKPDPDPPACTIRGTKSDDTLRGTERRDVICVRGGNDTVNALGGNDIVRGGSGNDAIIGGDGADELYGGRGRDALVGGDGRDRLVGGPGKDDTDQ